MNKAEQIIASSKRVSRRKPGFLGFRGRVALMTLTMLLMLFVFFTQPHVREIFASWTSLFSG
ncbi:hypothetical protein [Ruegeria faecimaris]|uniref:Uncharacterized protein n=1 Tax=Ruegeria faecimaris TaxID=686389 RepID=A0A521EWF3_9RHOB|nr:hypothetical protein [Ruegeria faecimaris]SMO88282.1 hypothetical protein SAMN06265380_11456 [Ruegeria faecimaris]